MRFSGFPAVLAVAALVAMPAAANPLSRMLAKSGLTPEDFNLMREAEQTLLAGAQGGAVQWNNPASEAHGDVRLRGKEGDCLLVQHQAFLKGSQTPKQARRKFCPSGGGWLLSQ